MCFSTKYHHELWYVDVVVTYCGNACWRSGSYVCLKNIVYQQQYPAVLER